MTDGESRLARFPFPLGGVCPAALSGLDGDDLAWVFTIHMCYHRDVSIDETLDYFTRIKDGDGVLSFCRHGHFRHEDDKECPEPRNYPRIYLRVGTKRGWQCRFGRLGMEVTGKKLVDVSLEGLWCSWRHCSGAAGGGLTRWHPLRRCRSRSGPSYRLPTCYVAADSTPRKAGAGRPAKHLWL